MPVRDARAVGAVDGRKPPRPARKAATFGIKTKLQLAFGAVAILTVVAAGVAITSFSETERGFERVSGREVPLMTDALRLSAASGEISAAAARFVAAKSTDDRRLIATQIASRSRELDQIMTRLRGAETVIVGIQPEVAFAMVQLGMRMEDVRTALDLEEGLTLLERLTAGEGDGVPR